MNTPKEPTSGPEPKSLVPTRSLWEVGMSAEEAKALLGSPDFDAERRVKAITDKLKRTKQPYEE